MKDSLGVYISVPFCKAKCTYCNFASGVFGAERMDRVCGAGVCGDCGVGRGCGRMGPTLGGLSLPRRVDSVFFGGGTPEFAERGADAAAVWTLLREEFELAADAEITLECAPGQLGDETLEEMLRQGMNRMSFRGAVVCGCGGEGGGAAAYAGDVPGGDCADAGGRGGEHQCGSDRGIAATDGRRVGESRWRWRWRAGCRM